jgi:hypothetical protein
MENRIKKAIEIAVRFGGTDGDHHKAWVIDQMVRALTGCPEKNKRFLSCNGSPYTAKVMVASKEYKKLIAEAKAGEDGPNTYSWDVGIAP